MTSSTACPQGEAEEDSVPVKTQDCRSLTLESALETAPWLGTSYEATWIPRAVKRISNEDYPLITTFKTNFPSLSTLLEAISKALLTLFSPVKR